MVPYLFTHIFLSIPIHAQHDTQQAADMASRSTFNQFDFMRGDQLSKSGNLAQQVVLLETGLNKHIDNVKLMTSISNLYIQLNDYQNLLPT